MEKVQRIVVAGVLIKDNRGLIIRRSPDEDILPNVWELPSGKVEFGEAPSQALVREYREETNLDIEPILPFSVFHYVVEKKDYLRHTIQINYLVRLKIEGPLKLSTAHSEYKWISRNDLDLLSIDDVLKDIVIKALLLSGVISSSVPNSFTDQLLDAGRSGSIYPLLLSI